MASAPCNVCGSREGPGHLCSGQASLLGKTLDGRYQIEQVLGQGGMGMVFLATQTSMRRPVAIKTLHPALAAAPTFFERFRREAEVASNLRHPNIITVFDFGKAPDGTCYYVMEYLEGESLKQIVKRDGPMSLRRASAIIEQAARGLAHAHDQGCVHRDLKPHNIMVQRLDGSDFVKVLDFGLVKAVEQDEEEQLTSTGQVLGTPQYMPPEQAGGESVDQRSDLYSLAGVYYHCLTGTSPFGANTVRKALKAALTEIVPPVSTHRMGAAVPEALDVFFRKGLSREREERHQSAQELVEGIYAALEGLSDAELDALPSNAAPATRREGGSGSGARRVSLKTPASGSRGARSPLPPGVIVSGGAAVNSTPPPPAAASSVVGAARPAWFKWAIAGSAVVLLLAGVALGLRDPGPTPVPLGSETPKAMPLLRVPPVRVDITSVPTGAAVFRGQKQVGETPMTLNLEREQEHRLTFRMTGFNPVQQIFEYRNTAEDHTAVEIRLDPVVAKTSAVAADKPPRIEKASGKQPAPRKRPKDDIPVFE